MHLDQPYVFCHICHSNKTVSVLYLTSCAHVVCSGHLPERPDPRKDKICCPVCKTMGAAIIELNENIPDEVKQYFTSIPEQLENIFATSQFQYSAMRSRITYQQKEIEKLAQKNEMLKDLLKDARASLQQKEEYKATITRLQQELQTYRSNNLTPPRQTDLTSMRSSSTSNQQYSSSEINQSFVNQFNNFKKRSLMNIDNGNNNPSPLSTNSRHGSPGNISGPMAQSTSIGHLSVSPVSNAKVMGNNMQNNSSDRHTVPIKEYGFKNTTNGYRHPHNGSANSKVSTATSSSRLSILSATTQTSTDSDYNNKRQSLSNQDPRGNARSLSLNLRPPVSSRWSSKMRLGVNRLNTSSSVSNHGQNVNTRRLNSANKEQSPFF